MNLPFTAEQFYEVFTLYNQSVAPAQLLLLAMAVLLLFAVVRRKAWAGPAMSLFLAVLWFWSGLVYHGLFFSRINPLAWGFAALSVLGGLVFLWQGVLKRRIRPDPAFSRRTAAGWGLIGFSLLAYPFWSWAAGHPYPGMPTFGLPCPNTLFTVGMLALSNPAAPRSTYVVPLIWSLIGAQAAFLLAVPQDLSLLVAAIAALWLLVPRRAAI